MGGDALMQCNHHPNFYFEKLLNACLSFGGSQGWAAWLMARNGLSARPLAASLPLGDTWYSTARALAEHNASIVKRCFIGFMSLFLNLACRKVKYNKSYFSCTILLFGMTIFRKQTHQQRLPLFPIATGSATAPRLMPLGFIGYPHVAGIAALAVNVRLLKL